MNLDLQVMKNASRPPYQTFKHSTAKHSLNIWGPELSQQF